MLLQCSPQATEGLLLGKKQAVAVETHVMSIAYKAISQARHVHVDKERWLT